MKNPPPPHPPSPPLRQNMPRTSDDSADLRRRAELRLKDQPSKHPPIQSDADNLRQLHELKVHQIELEMQNEELLDSRNRDGGAVGEIHRPL